MTDQTEWLREKIGQILGDDPICIGRVTSETVNAIAALSEATPGQAAELRNSDTYYLRPILRHLREYQGLCEMGPSVGTEALADNIEWLDCRIAALSAEPQADVPYQPEEDARNDQLREIFHRACQQNFNRWSTGYGEPPGSYKPESWYCHAVSAVFMAAGFEGPRLKVRRWLTDGEAAPSSLPTDVPDLTSEEEAKLVKRINANPYLQPSHPEEDCHVKETPGHKQAYISHVMPDEIEPVWFKHIWASILCAAGFELASLDRERSITPAQPEEDALVIECAWGALTKGGGFPDDPVTRNGFRAGWVEAITTERARTAKIVEAARQRSVVIFQDIARELAQEHDWTEDFYTVTVEHFIKETDSAFAAPETPVSDGGDDG
ncbi:MAG: hypothetical protein AAGE05_04295 [Pseudomonadota bacterium]